MNRILPAGSPGWYRRHLARKALMAATLLCATMPLATVLDARPVPVQEGSDANGSRTENVERLALWVMQTAAVRAATEQGLARYRTSFHAAKPDGARYAKSAMDNVAALASLYAAMGTAPDPTFVWLFAPPRRWHGYTVPGSRWYGDNVDTIYRGARVEAGSSYEVTLRPGSTLPSQLSIMLYDQFMYENGVSERLDIPPLSLEITDRTPRNRDGSITVTVGPEPANGRPNHLLLKQGVKQIFVREIRGDGALPAVRLSIRRTKGPAPASKTIDELGAEAAVYIASAVEGSIQVDRVFGKRSENQLSPLRVRWIENTGSPDQKLVTDEPLGPDKALGFVSPSTFNIKEDEALILTLDMMGTRYLSVNIYRPFALSPEHVYRTSSLNNLQAKANPDGTFTFVVARSDPGVYNWLDTSGLPYGSLTTRWQGLTRPVSGTLGNAVKWVKLVKLSELRRELPPTMVWVTPRERAAQRAARAKQYKLRCLGTPCDVGGELDQLY